jgi:orotidine-5'-phosphate decarboxylase
MAERNFRALLEAQWERGNFVCVGLDSEFSKIPESARKYHDRTTDSVGNVLYCKGNVHVAKTVIAFNRAIVEATKDLVCAYKPNAAFYEAQGAEGVAALQRTIADIHTIAPDVPVILDAKRADIGNTNAGYVQMAFDRLEADAITVHPYLGQEALKPFLEREDKCIFVLCRTSNKGAGEFQDLPVLVRDELSWMDPKDRLVPLYQVVAYQVAVHWNIKWNCGLVVGATYPEELREVREIARDVPILIPGVGFQTKEKEPMEVTVQKVVEAGRDSRGKGMIINSSRGIIFASSGPDFAEAARRETIKLRDLINKYRVTEALKEG